VRLYDAETGELLRVLETSPRTAHEVVFSPDGEMIASRIGLSDGVVRLWDVDTGQVVCDLAGAGMANSLAMSPDGELLAASGPSYGNVVDVWEVTSGQKILTLEHNASLRGVAFSPDGKLLASTGYEQGRGDMGPGNRPACSDTPGTQQRNVEHRLTIRTRYRKPCDGGF